MKCNHCKKIIPEREEIRKGNQCFHEECAETVKKMRNRKAKIFFGSLLAVMVVVYILVSILANRISNSREK